MKNFFKLTGLGALLFATGMAISLLVPSPQAQAAPFTVPTQKQVNTLYALTNTLFIRHSTTNLPGSISITNTLLQDRDVLVGWTMVGLDATNAGLTAFQFDSVNTTNKTKTTTRKYTVTGTANGTTAVNDTAVLLKTTLGPAEALVLSGITNAVVNVGTGSTNTLVISNLWIQLRD